jgi:hypothetical protein
MQKHLAHGQCAGLRVDFVADKLALVLEPLRRIALRPLGGNPDRWFSRVARFAPVATLLGAVVGAVGQNMS